MSYNAVFLKVKAFERLCMERNLTQETLAKMLGVQRAYLSTLKNPKHYGHHPSPDLRERMLKLFGCKFDDLFVIRKREEVKK